MKNKTLDLNDPKDAFIFLTVAIQEVLPGHADRVTYEGGRVKKFTEMNNEELVNAAIELLPIYQAAFPDNVQVTYEQ